MLGGRSQDSFCHLCWDCHLLGTNLGWLVGKWLVMAGGALGSARDVDWCGWLEWWRMREKESFGSWLLEKLGMKDLSVIENYESGISWWGGLYTCWVYPSNTSHIEKASGLWISGSYIAMKRTRLGRRYRICICPGNKLIGMWTALNYAIDKLL